MSELLDQIKEIEELCEKSTSVVSWYPHTHDGTVRGPFNRWFVLQKGDDTNGGTYENNVLAPYQNDVEYCAAAMNKLPKLCEALRELVNALNKLDGVDLFVTNTTEEALETVRKIMEGE